VDAAWRLAAYLFGTEDSILEVVSQGIRVTRNTCIRCKVSSFR
jgi:hypothetical protein